MNVYVASPFELYIEAAKVRDILHAAGHACTSSWIDLAAGQKGARDENVPNASVLASMCVSDVYRSDALIAIVGAGGTGMWIETGIAIAQRIPCLFVPPSFEAAGMGPARLPDAERIVRVRARSVFTNLGLVVASYADAVRALKP